MKYREWVAFALMGLIWGSAYVWVKIGLEEIEPVALVAFRLLLSVPGLALVVIWRGVRLPRDYYTWYLLGLMGLTESVLPLLLVTWGQQFVTSGVAALLGATVPLFTMLIAHFIFVDERFTMQRSLSLLLGFVGVAILVGGGMGRANFQVNLMGQLAILAASLLHAGNAVFVRRTLQHVSPTAQTFGITLTATISIWVWLPFTSEWPLVIPTQAISWMALLWLGLLGSGAAYLLYYWMIQTSGATSVSLITYVIPPISLVLGVLFLQEQFDWQLILSVLLITASVVFFHFEWAVPFMRWRLKAKPRL